GWPALALALQRVETRRGRTVPVTWAPPEQQSRPQRCGVRQVEALYTTCASSILPRLQAGGPPAPHASHNIDALLVTTVLAPARHGRGARRSSSRRRTRAGPWAPPRSVLRAPRR